mmetsp:Transcript_1442/g.2078  ORF Transcript_1442/g.2078 Transcript_1442/m.2078 type:complete len:389 (+) Transcript_1442:258-1424(+)|eukprot:CAMPEP_0184867120 /NCGR_PEP_ID=MMETSP0580-20130426/25055_1 /TAXON_ID=1118495 /ORGANISM="Dactyliosolen fragilissimus" /LENGTH=388 /DNA_ID=CAMNT_0027367169 /DNA_START=193 /DNA_END=1359 /DNA_ORIENTATION=-
MRNLESKNNNRYSSNHDVNKKNSRSSSPHRSSSHRDRQRRSSGEPGSYSTRDHRSSSTRKSRYSSGKYDSPGIQTVKSVEKVFNTVFGSCSYNIKEFFDDPRRRRRSTSSGQVATQHRRAGSGSDTTASTEPSSSSRSKQVEKKRLRLKTSSSWGKDDYMKGSQQQQQQQKPISFPVQKNTEIKVAQNDEVSALSGFTGYTLEHMVLKVPKHKSSSQQQRPMTLEPILSMDNENSYTESTLEDTNNVQMLSPHSPGIGTRPCPSFTSAISRASSTTTEFESIWKRRNEKPTTTTTPREELNEVDIKNFYNSYEKGHHRQYYPRTVQKNKGLNNKFAPPPPTREWRTVPSQISRSRTTTTNPYTRDGRIFDIENECSGRSLLHDYEAEI